MTIWIVLQVKALLLYMLKCTVDGNRTLQVLPHCNHITMHWNYSYLPI